VHHPAALMADYHSRDPAAKPTSVRPPTARYATFLHGVGMKPIVVGQHAGSQRLWPGPCPHARPQRAGGCIC
jgi:hypothetical protein